MFMFNRSIALAFALGPLALLDGRALAVPAIEKRDTYFFDDLARYQQESVDVLEDYDSKNVFWWTPFYIAPKLRPGTTKPFVSYRLFPAASATAIVTMEFMDSSVTQRLKEAISIKKGRNIEDIDLKPLPLDRVSIELFSDLTELGVFQKETLWKNETSFFPATVPVTFPVSEFELKLLQQKQANFVINARVQFAAKRALRSISRTIETPCVFAKIDERFFVLEADARDSEYGGADLLILLGSFQQCVTNTITFDTDLNAFTESEKIASWIDYLLEEKIIEKISADGAPIRWKVGEKAEWQRIFAKPEAIFLKEFPADLQDYDFRIGTMIRQ
jgi:hypothetical protein